MADFYNPEKYPDPTVYTVIRKIEPEENIIEETTGGTTMKKTLTIEGMMCKHCQAHAEKALNAMEGVTATVDLEAASAYCEVEEGVTDEMLKAAIAEAGYEVTAIQ